MMRYMRKVPDEAWDDIRGFVKLRNCHWYVRQQAALLISMRKLAQISLDAIRRIFENEANMEVKRAWVRALAQVPKQELQEIIRSLLLAVEPKLQRLGRAFRLQLKSRDAMPFNAIIP